MNKIYYSQPTQPNTFAIRTSQHTTKNYKRACLSVTAFLPTLKTNFFGNSRASIERINGFKKLINRLIKKKCQLVTMYIKNCRNSSKIKVCSPFELSYRLRVLYSKIGNFSYTGPLGTKNKSPVCYQIGSYFCILTFEK